MFSKRLLKSKIYILLALFVLHCSESIEFRKPKKIGVKQRAIEQTDVQRARLKGRVKMVERHRFKAVVKLGKLKKGKLYYTEVYKYNEKGYLTEFIHLRSDRLDSRILHLYDDNGNLIEKAHYNSDGDLTWKIILKYDEKNNLIESANYKSKTSSFASRTIYEYDEQDNLITATDYNSNDSLDWKYTYRYNDRGNLIEWVRYTSEGSLNLKTTSQYDDKGNLIQLTNYKADGSVDIKFTNKYDEEGKHIESTNYKADGSVDMKFTYQYKKYDSAGNWTEVIDFVVNEETANKATEITERKITYY